MTTLKDLPLSNRRALARVAEFTARAPAAARLPPHAMIRALRAELHMTQTQLAKRAGITQSHLARIEAGKVDPQLSTLRRIFGALFCDVLVVPHRIKRPQDIMLERVKERARRNVLRVTGTMAFEKQTPDDETIRNLIRLEEARLLAHPSSEMWTDPA